MHDRQIPVSSSAAVLRFSGGFQHQHAISFVWDLGSHWLVGVYGMGMDGFGSSVVDGTVGFMGYVLDVLV